MTVFDIIERICIGTGIGFLIGLTGVGGGSLVVPTLVLLLGYTADKAVGTATAFAFMTKISALGAHWRLKTIDWQSTGLFLIGAVPGTVIACYVVATYVTNQSARDQLTWFVIVVIIASLLMMIYSQTRKPKPVDAPTTERPEADLLAAESDPADIAAAVEQALPQRAPLTPGRIVLGICCGFGVGVLLGATSVGGAIIVIPLLVMFFGLPVSRTVGTSIAIAIALTLIASLAYTFIPRPGGTATSTIAWPTAILMAVASIPGVYFGSRLTKTIPERQLGRLVSLIMCIAAGMLIYKMIAPAAEPPAEPPTQSALQH